MKIDAHPDPAYHFDAFRDPDPDPQATTQGDTNTKPNVC